MFFVPFRARRDSGLFVDGGNPNDKRRALSHLALHRYRPAQQLGQPLCNGQPQSGSLVLGVRSCHLAELVEDDFQVMLRDADPGVRYRDRQAPAFLPGENRHLSRVRKLERVAQQVDNDLPQPDLVRVRLSDIVRRLVIERHARLHKRADDGAGGCDQPLHVEGRGRDVQPSRLDPGEVQDVVDQVQEVV